MAKRKRIVYDFKDTYDCIRKCNGVKTLVDKKQFLLKIKEGKIRNSIKIRGRWQLFRNPLYLDNTVCRYVILSKKYRIIIKNVYGEDLYFDDLESLADYRRKIVVSDYDFHPSFRDEDNLEFENPGSQKRR